MKINSKVIVALVIVIAVVFWVVTSLQTRSYTGRELTFDVGSGTVTMTNPSDEAIPVQLVGARSGTFTVASTINDVSGRSTRQSNGGRSTQLFEFLLPPGVSEFSVIRNAGVSFVSTADVLLEAVVQPLGKGEVRTTFTLAAAAIAAALFFMSYSTGHSWINLLRGKRDLPLKPQPVVVTDGGQGTALKSYGDNRDK